MDEFLVIGSGSAGRRHATALRKCFPTASISIVKRFGSSQPLDSLDGQNIRILPSISDGIRLRPQFVVIASAASQHLVDFKEVCEHTDLVLIEKPLALSATEGTSIIDLARRTSCRVLVGYHLRFSETVLAFHRLIRSLGDTPPTEIRLAYGQHLRYWRPLVPANQSVTARKDLGGGVLRELSHEIDAVYYLGIRPSHVSGVVLRLDGAPTDGQVETSADFTLEGREGFANIHLDMTAESPYRYWDAVYPDATIRADLLNGTIARLDGNEVAVLHTSATEERNRAGEALIQAVLDPSIISQIGPSDIHQGLRIVNTIEAIEDSARSGERVAIRE